MEYVIVHIDVDIEMLYTCVHSYFARGSGCEVLLTVMSTSVCLSVCLFVRDDISVIARAIFT